MRSVGLKYRLLTEADCTLKGYVLGRLIGRKESGLEFWALRDVSLDFRRGEVVGIIGPNGSGKSSLLKLIAGVIDPTEGELKMFAPMPPIMDGGSVLNPFLTGRQNARLYGALLRIAEDEVLEGVAQIAQFSELGAFFEAPVRIYSSGMIARLVFSIFALWAPDILLIDELISVGDEHFQKKSFIKMRKLIERGSLVIIVSHNTSLMEGLCDTLILLDRGRVVTKGKPSEVASYYRRHFV
jgi:ABC-type polysaccharide/polyol phosphate transport system ATPase subunit